MVFINPDHLAQEIAAENARLREARRTKVNGHAAPPLYEDGDPGAYPDAYLQSADVPLQQSGPANPPSAGLRKITAAELQTKIFPSVNFVLPGLVPEGATLLVSRPKLGKSWMVLELAIATATGGFTLGTLKPFKGDVLYLALEDGERRLQSRMTKILPSFSGTWPKNLTFATEWPRQDQDGLVHVENWIKGQKNPRLVIVDTLAQFRPRASRNETLYSADYAAVAGLQKLASTYNIAGLIVHHDRKAEADDPFDTVSGSLGITGAADTILILKRRSGGVTLYVRGRDIEEAEKALQFDKSSCRWTILGDAADVHRSDERTRILEALEASTEPMGPTEITKATGMKYANVRYLLHQMALAGEVGKASRGKYKPPP